MYRKVIVVHFEETRRVYMNGEEAGIWKGEVAYVKDLPMT